MTDYASMTPGCSCKGLSEAMEEINRLTVERERCRRKALKLSCAYLCDYETCPHPGCHPNQDGYCDDVIKEVDA